MYKMELAYKTGGDKRTFKAVDGPEAGLGNISEMFDKRETFKRQIFTSVDGQ